MMYILNLFKLTRKLPTGMPMPALTPSRSDRPGYAPHSTWSRLALACSGPRSTRPGLLWAVHDLPVPAPGRSHGHRAAGPPHSTWSRLDLPMPGLADSEARACYSVTSMTRVALRHWHSTRDLKSTRRGLPVGGLLWAALRLDSPGPALGCTWLARLALHSREPALGRSGLGLSLRGRLFAAVLTPGNVSILH